MNDAEKLTTRYREAVLYVICGGFTTLVTWGSYAVFVWAGMELNASNILSWACGILFAFVVNKFIVFSSMDVRPSVIAKEAGSFLSARIFTGVIAALLFPILMGIGLNQSLLGTAGFPAKIVTSVIEIALNWVFSKYMIFTHKARPGGAQCAASKDPARPDAQTQPADGAGVGTTETGAAESERPQNEQDAEQNDSREDGSEPYGGVSR
ncbi:MAG: GtrA family protein [Candidatus Methanoplasma sp.]|jgi:putative flippase GtrA|nr:GtrA family protein [Candidatus Methanoplasma sp.]